MPKAQDDRGKYLLTRAVYCTVYWFCVHLYSELVLCKLVQ